MRSIFRYVNWCHFVALRWKKGKRFNLIERICHESQVHCTPTPLRTKFPSLVQTKSISTSSHSKNTARDPTCLHHNPHPRHTTAPSGQFPTHSPHTDSTRRHNPIKGNKRWKSHVFTGSVQGQFGVCDMTMKATTQQEQHPRENCCLFRPI